MQSSKFILFISKHKHTKFNVRAIHFLNLIPLIKLGVLQFVLRIKGESI